MRIKYKYVINKLTNMKNIQTKDYLKTLLGIMDTLKPKSKTKKSQSIKSSKRKTKRSSSLN